MKRLLLLSLVAMLAAVPLFVARAQSPGFDLDAYRAYLAQHKNASAGDVLREHPAPLFSRTVKTSGVRYLDSARIKFKLTSDELALLDQNGFVVTERLSYPSFGDALSDVWNRDMPVLVTSDAILHAVHMSYDDILKSTEKTWLSNRLASLLDILHNSSLPALDARHGAKGAMTPMLRDVDVYLSVARRLLLAKAVGPFYKENATAVDDLMKAIDAEQPASVTLFSSTERTYDFSQFTVRGHYAEDPLLGQYFKAMIWLGRTELMLTKPVQQGVPQQTDEDIQRQIIDALLLKDALALSQTASTALSDIDGMITFLVGESDNVNAKNLDEVQRDAGIASPEEVLDPARYAAFTKTLATKPFAEQRINSQILMSDPSDPEQLKPPSAFLLLGQRFIVDSYVLGNVVFDRILKDGAKVLRMLPLPMDALFALGNDASAQLLQDELARWSYAPNLTSLRYLIDSYGDDFWGASLYNTWLHSIRALNPGENLDGLPAFMRTGAWWQEKMNTQLASWAELRHDNLLYAKQSYTGGAGCSFPEGYVEPYPELYARLSAFARSAGTTFSGYGMKDIATYFQRMGGVMDTLRTISEKELSNGQLEQGERNFLQRMLYSVSRVCTIGYDGWYPRLFFERDVQSPDVIVADVHTAPTDAAGNPVGWVLHAGTGKVNMGFAIAPSQQGDQTVYAGPMLSYYEHVTTNFKRMTDKEWEAAMLPATSFPRPDWTNVYLADRDGRRLSTGPTLLTGIDVSTRTAPSSAAMPVLHAVYPNPLTGSSAIISFTTNDADRATVSVDVFDASGRQVRSLFRGSTPKGTYLTRFDGNDDAGRPLPSGSYVVRLSTAAGVATQTVAVVR